MNLQLTLVKQKEASMLICAALAIALECYRDMESSYGYIIRRDQLLDAKRALELIDRFGTTKEGEQILLDLKDVLLLVTVFDITLKVLRSDDPYRFVPIFADDAAKRSSLRSELITHCTDMTTELSEQAIYRYEVGQHRRYLAKFQY
jgi:hypothetical protein